MIRGSARGAGYGVRGVGYGVRGVGCGAGDVVAASTARGAGCGAAGDGQVPRDPVPNWMISSDSPPLTRNCHTLNAKPQILNPKP